MSILGIMVIQLTSNSLTNNVLIDFDPQFNAITGLNGSGKSNIFDAICFVMGIS